MFQLRLSAMRWFLLFCAIAVFNSSQSTAAEPVLVPAIRLPVSKVPVSPVSVTQLAADALFVIDADEEYLILDSRQGVVQISEETGPLTIYSVFADGSGKLEKRKYTAKHIWIIEAVQAGEAELIISKVGEKDRTKAIRTTLVVSGHGPRPPPIPPVPPQPVPPPLPPDPAPIPPPPVKTALLTGVVVEDALQRTPATAAIISDLGFWKSIEGQVETLHVVPSVSPSATQYKRLIDAAKGKLPLFILLDAKSYKVLYSGELPKDKVEVAKLVNSLTK